MFNMKYQWNGWTTVVGREKQVHCFVCCTWTLETGGQSPVQGCQHCLYRQIRPYIKGLRPLWFRGHALTASQVLLSSYSSMRFRTQLMALDLSHLMSSNHSKFIQAFSNLKCLLRPLHHGTGKYDLGDTCIHLGVHLEARQDNSRVLQTLDISIQAIYRALDFCIMLSWNLKGKLSSHRYPH